MSPEESKRRYSVWQAMGLSFYSKDLYRDVKENWKGTGFGLLFLVLVVIGVVVSVHFQVITSEKFPGFTRQIPEFQMTKGVLTTSVKPQPYRIDFAGGCFVMDTTGKIKTLDQVPGAEKLQSIALVTKTGFLSRRVRLGRSVDEAHLFKPTYNFSVTRDGLDRWTAIIVRWSGIGAFAFFLPFFFLFEVFALLIYALIGVLFAEMTDRNLDYGDALRLAVVSHIPVLFLFWALNLAQVKIPMPILWSLMVSAAYVYFAVSSQAKKAEPLT